MSCTLKEINAYNNINKNVWLNKKGYRPVVFPKSAKKMTIFDSLYFFVTWLRAQILYDRFLLKKLFRQKNRFFQNVIVFNRKQRH